MKTITRGLEKIETVLAASEHVRICPHCIKVKKPPIECTHCNGSGFVNSDGSCITEAEAELLGRVAESVVDKMRK